MVLAVLVLAAANCTQSYAQEPDEGHGKQFKQKMEAVLEQLKLTPKQETQIRESHKSDREQVQNMFRSQKEQRKALGEELDKPTPDMEKVKALTANLKDFESRMIDQRVKSVLKMKEILTPEQYQTFSNSLAQMRQERRSKQRREQ
jgi:Spy/CpxP family protein refolding chaperone